MQLRCRRHRVSGVWLPLPCPKCARELRKKKTVDTNFPAVSSQNYRSGESSRLIPAEAIPQSVGSRERAESCLFCRASSVGVVFGFRVCRPHGERVNQLSPRGVCVGAAWHESRRKIANAIRERR